MDNDGFFDFWCLSGGVESSSVRIAQGIQVGSPTGGDKGGGTINCAADIYKNNTAYTSPDYVFETVYGAPSTMSAYVFPSLASVEAFTRTHYHLPGISREASGIFARADTLLEKLEEAYLHLFDLDARVRSLESSCNTL